MADEWIVWVIVLAALAYGLHVMGHLGTLVNLWLSGIKQILGLSSGSEHKGDSDPGTWPTNTPQEYVCIRVKVVQVKRGLLGYRDQVLKQTTVIPGLKTEALELYDQLNDEIDRRKVGTRYSVDPGKDYDIFRGLDNAEGGTK